MSLQIIMKGVKYNSNVKDLIKFKIMQRLFDSSDETGLTRFTTC